MVSYRFRVTVFEFGGHANLTPTLVRLQLPAEIELRSKNEFKYYEREWGAK